MVSKKTSGMTLVELLVCLTIIGVLFSFASPFGPTLYKKNQLQVITDQIKSAIRYAKLQAIIHGEHVILSYRPNTKEWSSGIALYTEHPHALKTLIHEWTWPTSGCHITWQGFQSNQYLRFAPELSESAVNGTFIIELAQQKSTKLIINRIGRVVNVL